MRRTGLNYPFYCNCLFIYENYLLLCLCLINNYLRILRWNCKIQISYILSLDVKGFIFLHLFVSFLHYLIWLYIIQLVIILIRYLYLRSKNLWNILFVSPQIWIHYLYQWCLDSVSFLENRHKKIKHHFRVIILLGTKATYYWH